MAGSVINNVVSMIMQVKIEQFESKGVLNPSRETIERAIAPSERQRFVPRYIVGPESKIISRVEDTIRAFEGKVDATGTPYFLEGGKVMWELWELEKIHIPCLLDPIEEHCKSASYVIICSLQGHYMY